MDTMIEFVSTTYVIKSATLRHQLDEHDEPWFVAKDVCDYLEIQNVSDACSRLHSADVRISDGYTEAGAKRSMNMINEPGLYQLIFQSRKPEAHAFQMWVLRELLPQLRRTGHYSLRSRNGRPVGRVPRGRQPFLDEIKRRKLSQARALAMMNELDLPAVPQVRRTTYSNETYGTTRASRELRERAAMLLSMPIDQLFTD